MATLTGTKCDTFAEAKHESAMFGTNTYKVCLLDTEPTAATDSSYTTHWSGNDLSTANGYTAGGAEVSYSSSQTSGTFTMVGDTADVSWTASGGNIGPFQWIGLYDDTHASKQVVGYWSLSSAHTITDGSSYTFETNGTTLYTST